MHTPPAERLLRDLAGSAPTAFTTIFGFRSTRGACFGSTTVRKPPKLSDGFRPGRVPIRLLQDRYLQATTPVSKAMVSRADHAWIHGRDTDPRQPRLIASKVAVLGCGSLGSSVASLLAQAGVGNLLLVDPEKLEWPNISRHRLGARSVGKSKAEELVSALNADHPHLGSVKAVQDSVRPGSQELMVRLAGMDLLVSTMGDWPAECFLNDWQQSLANPPPILYGWLEPRAAAAHAVLVRPGGGCLQCGFDALGHPRLEVTRWPPQERELQSPGCSASFSPYGPAELCWAHALVSSAAINTLVAATMDRPHRVWVGCPDRILASGGKLADSWLDTAAHPTAGNRVHAFPWPRNPGCSACSGARSGIG